MIAPLVGKLCGRFWPSFGWTLGTTPSNLTGLLIDLSILAFRSVTLIESPIVTFVEHSPYSRLPYSSAREWRFPTGTTRKKERARKFRRGCPARSCYRSPTRFGSLGTSQLAVFWPHRGVSSAAELQVNSRMWPNPVLNADARRRAFARASVAGELVALGVIKALCRER